MNSFIDLERSLGGQPPGLGVLLSRIDVGRGREGLHLDQLPELLRWLAERTRVESIRASTALEGYEVDVERAAKLAQLTPARVRNRNEREFAGYRDAMDEIMRAGAPERLSIPFILHLHRVMFTPTDGGGGRLTRDDNLIAARDDEGRRIVIFEPPGHERVEWMLGELVARYNAACDEEAAHPLLLLGAFILDLLAIHPVADGNGRLARLITTHELLRLGYGVARYASVEQRIFETKNAYYAALRLSQANWHDATHTVWPWMEYLAGVIADAYDAFEHRLAAADSLEGLSKQEIVRRHIAQLPAGGRFRIRDLRATLPGISDQTFRLVLAELRQAGVLAGDGTGPQAGWTLIGPKPDR